MGSISAPDRLLLRQPVDTQTSLERCYFLPMNNVWTGRVNEAPARGDRSITYDAVGPGEGMAAGFAFADLTAYGAGLEVWFGSAAGLKDRGVRRLRSMGVAAAAGTLVCDWHDDIDLVDDDFITIKHFYPPWPKYSYFTAAGPVFYKDGPDGTTYAASGDANETPAPHVIMGRNYAGEMPTVGNLTISFDASNSVDVAGGGGGVTYAWDITPPVNASFDNDAIAAPTLTVTAEGEWWIHCTVTINGRSTIAHRVVIVGGGITEFTRGPISHQYDSTDIAVTLSLTSPETGADIRGVMTWDQVQDHSLAIITATDYYGATQKSIGFHNEDVYDDREHIVFCGYLILENMDLIEDGTGAVELQAVSLVDVFLYSLSLTGMTTASQWYEMINTQMIVAGNLLHLVRWHSTLLDIADWWLPWSDTVRRSANEEFSEGDMLERARTLCRARLMGMTANPQGEIFVETDLNLRNFADRAAATTTLILTEADVAGTKRARTRRRGDLVRILADGGYSTGVMGSYQPFFAASQNVAKSEARPALVHVDRLMVPSQAETNRVAARLQAVANRRYIEVDLDFAGNYREVFSPAGQQWTDLGNLFAGTLQANISGDTGLVDTLCVPRQVTHSHDNATGHTSVSVIFDMEAPVELEGRTITPPAVPSEDPSDGGWDFPEAPEWPVIPDVMLLTNLLAFDIADGCWLRFAGATDWVERNGARVGTDDDDVQGGWDPWWFTPAKHNTTDVNQSILWACQVGKIWRSLDGGQNWTDMTPNIDADPPDDYSQTPPPAVDTVTYVQRVDSIHQNKLHVFSVEYYDGAIWGGWLLVTDNDGELGSWTWYSIQSAGTLITDGTYYYPAADGNAYPYDGAWSEAIVNTANPGNALGIDDGVGATYTYTYLALNGYEVTWIFFDFGGQLTTGVAATVEARYITPLTGGFTSLFRGGASQDVWISTDGVIWTQITVTANDIWTNGDSAVFTWGPAVAGVASQTFRYVALRFLPAWSGGPINQDAQIDTLRVSNVTGATGGPATQLRPIWMDMDSEDGSTLYMTVWIDDNLYLWAFDTTDFTAAPGTTDLGGCTIAQLNAKTYVAYPHTPTFSNSTCYVFGRMQGPAGLANPSHLIRTVNGGAAWTALVTTFGADYISAFRAEGVTAGARTFHGIRAGAGVPAFYQGLETLTLKGNLSFGAGAAVYVDALSINNAGQVAVGSDTAAAIMIIISDDGINWTDVTDSYPVAGAVQSLTYI